MASPDRAFSAASSVPEDRARRGETPLDEESPRTPPRAKGEAEEVAGDARAPVAGQKEPIRTRTGRRGLVSARGAGPFDWLFRREVVILAWIALVVGIAMPPRGVGFSTCTMYVSTGLPCPGCGITRSVSSLFHGHWVWSWRYHPLGWLVALWVIGTAGSVFWPRGWRSKSWQFVAAHEKVAWRVFWVLLALWLLYGIVRLILVAKGLWRFPPSFS